MGIHRPDITTAQRYQLIWAVVRRIPRGRVATYGQVARLAGLARGARLVGRALGAAPDRPGLPWHRVVAAGGRLALPPGSAAYRAQVRLLNAEGVRCRGGRADLRGAGWQQDMDEILWGPGAFDAGNGR
jgi:methylated-DNA-protein-cysteine methyltransferase-like protein